jgi:hypothetical protein
MKSQAAEIDARTLIQVGKPRKRAVLGVWACGEGGWEVGRLGGKGVGGLGMRGTLG